VDVPGRIASYVAKFERAGVETAHRAFWYEYGTMNGLVVNNNQPTGTWWLYKRQCQSQGRSNVIRLAKGSPGFSGGAGCAELDYIQLT
jgi:hypothetical protein